MPWLTEFEHLPLLWAQLLHQRSGMRRFFADFHTPLVIASGIHVFLIEDGCVD
jgi:succinate dehydrogenase hydrophobic anchor subunit